MADQPLRLLHGEHGVDSPILDPYDDTITSERWYAWLVIGADREAGRPTARSLLGVALDADEPSWTLWWVRPSPSGSVVHRAEIIGATLVSACGYTVPAGGSAKTYPATKAAPRAKNRMTCDVCAHIAVPEAAHAAS